MNRVELQHDFNTHAFTTYRGIGTIQWTPDFTHTNGNGHKEIRKNELNGFWKLPLKEQAVIFTKTLQTPEGKGYYDAVLDGTLPSTG